MHTTLLNFLKEMVFIYTCDVTGDFHEATLYIISIMHVGLLKVVSFMFWCLLLSIFIMRAKIIIQL